MKITCFAIALCIASIILFNCEKRNSVRFDDRAFYFSLKKTDSVTSFVRCLKLSNSPQFCDSIYPEFKEIDVKGYVIDKGKLTLMTRQMVRYVEADEKDRFLALTIYLYQNNISSKKLFDDMLEICLRMDSMNIIANYELAKLRTDEFYVGLGAFLVDKMAELYHDKYEISRLKRAFEDEFGKDIYKKDMDYEEYLDLNPHYIED